MSDRIDEDGTINKSVERDAGLLLDRLESGRLIIALDMLLETASVSKAAQNLGLQASAVSRQLGQLRDALGDPLFVRSGRGLVPTPFAESLRPMIHALSRGIDAVFDQKRLARSGLAPFDTAWNVPASLKAPDLSVRPAHLADGEPSADQLAAKYAHIGSNSPPHSRLQKYCATISRGAGHRRPLAVDEAADMMALILDGEADPIQIGTLFGILQHRAITATEFAGFVQAIRAHVQASFGLKTRADIDWPCYTSPRVNSPPWYFHAARLVALDGHRVLLHGASGTGEAGGRLEVVAKAAGIPVCLDAAEAAEALDSRGIAFLPLVALSPQIYRLIGLSGVMGMRNPVHDSISLLNPANAGVSFTGVSSRSLKEVQLDAATLIDQNDIALLANVRGAAQVNPFRATTIHRRVGGQALDTFVKSVTEPRTEAVPYATTLEFWQGVWSGAMADPRAEQIIVATAAVALVARSGSASASYKEALESARGLWRDRLTLAANRQPV
nr:glycosyl transferase family protein [Rhizobium sp. ACO-34A]